MSQLVLETMKKLIKKINYYNQKYYEEEISEISDFEYDLLFYQLKNLEKEYPRLKQPDTPTEQVGFLSRKNFPSFTHPFLMGSLGNAFSIEEVISFLEKRASDLNITLEKLFPLSVALKFDGLALELIYKNGKLLVGATRGDGTVGENITKNVKKIKMIPQSIKELEQITSKNFNGTDFLVIRGEVIMNKVDFNAINHRLEEEGQPLVANPRNLVSGMMRQINPEKVLTTLNFFAYQVANWEDWLRYSSEFGFQNKILKMLNQWGFNCNKYSRSVCDQQELIDYLHQVSVKRHDLPYEIDGVVIKVDDGNIQKILGESGKRPRYAIAWKLPPEVKLTELIDVKFQIGRTGKITPVGILKPVRLAGAVIRRVTLHNIKEIIEKDLKIGDQVEIIRSGEVIPKVLKVRLESRTGNEKFIRFPTHCPICDNILQQDDILTFCVNEECPAKRYQNMVHFVSKEAMNLDGIGKEVIRELIEKKKIMDVGDLYALQGEDLDELERMGEKLKENILSSIENSKRVSLDRFIYALGIPGIGEKMSKIIARTFGSISNILELSKIEMKERLLAVDEIGDKLAEQISAFFTTIENRKLIERMIRRGIKLTARVDQYRQSKMSHKKIHFTGKLSLPRNMAKEKAEAAGAEISSSITKNLDYLVVGEEPGVKLKKAKELGVLILSETDFFEMIKVH